MKKIILLIVIFLPAILFAQPANDNCANAIALTAGTNCITGTNVGATVEAWENVAPTNAQCWASAPNFTVWYKFTPVVTGMFSVSLDNRLSDAGEPDTQMKLLSGTCGAFTLVDCSEDDGAANSLAALTTATLTAGVTYYIQVDMYGAAANNGPFCINVYQNIKPVNDCVNNAIDLTPLINGLSASTPFNCTHGFVYNTPGGGLTDDPTRQDVVGDFNGCNGYDLTMVRNPDHRDVWFKVNITAATPPAYIQLYPENPSYLVNWVLGLYQGTPVSLCPSGNITGLTYVDCSAGILVDVPPGNEKGLARDQALCSTPIHPRVDLSNLIPGTYYLRVWDFAGGDPDEGFFNLCMEAISPRPNTADTCTSANIGYLGPNFNVDVNTTYPGLSNAGSHGNACNTAINEPLLGATPAGQARDGCAGPWITYVGTINNVMNLTVIHSFVVNACPGCAPTAIVRLDNIANDGTFANVPQLQVMAPNNCTGSSQTIMNGVTRNTCIEMRTASNTPLPNGQYYIVVDGQDGQLLKYDLTLTLDYPCNSMSVCTVLPVELLSFTGENMGSKNKLQWVTASEINNDYFDVEKSYDNDEYVFLKQVKGMGNTTDQQEYVTFDNEAKDGITYYRLRQVDFDGHFEYSNTIAVKKGSKSSDYIYSVRESDNMLVVGFHSSTNQVIKWNILNTEGAVCSQGSMNVTDNDNEIKLPSCPGTGMFVFTIVNANGETDMKRYIGNK